MIITKLLVFEKLKLIFYPPLEKSIVDLKMVENLKISDKDIQFDIVIARPDDEFKLPLMEACEDILRTQLDPDVNVKMGIVIRPGVFSKMSNNFLQGVKHIIAVASGKGGVGKSTVSVNLAIALAKQGYKVGLLDADIFGPSIPKMFNTESERPKVESINGKDIVTPLEKYGVKILSIGYFVDPQNATVWRGPMASNAMKQMITDAQWGELDFFLIDMPPGTSDIHLTIVQTLSVTGAVVVSTPQEVALADAVKGINMFQNASIKVPVLGLVENMAWFTPAELPESKYFIFGKEGCKRLAEKMELPLLGQIPLVQSICESGDNGVPVALEEGSIIGAAFADLAKNVIEKLEYRLETQPPTKRVEVKLTR